MVAPNTFVSLLIMYGSVMFGAMAVLFWSFKGSFNVSGKLFLFSEILRIPTLIMIILAHLFPDFKTASSFSTALAFFLVSELTFVFSLYAFSKEDIKTLYMKALCAMIFYSICLHLVRLNSLALSNLMYFFMLASISSTAVWILSHAKDEKLRKVPFWIILKYIELIFLAISVVRIALQSFGIFISPMESGLLDQFFMSIMLSLLVFRYISYQSIWMTWASPYAKENKLNSNLLQSVRERNALMEQLVASNRRISISALASSLAHQLSQPLTGAALQAEAVRQNLIHRRNEADALQGVEKVADILRHLSDVVKNLRSLFSSQDDGLQKIELEPLCDEVIKLVKFSEKASGVTIETSGRLGSRILANPVQIQQVIVNLIDNAIEASENAQNRKIEIQVAEQGGRASLTIRDHGPGFPTEALDRLFDLYQTTKEGGMGVGLWLSRQIVEKYRGDIKIYNHTEGGACVSIEFPTTGG